MDFKEANFHDLLYGDLHIWTSEKGSTLKEMNLLLRGDNSSILM